MPQLYAEVYAPVLSGLTFRLGHFYSTIGYESIMAPANFFYSHSYTLCVRRTEDAHRCLVLLSRCHRRSPGILPTPVGGTTGKTRTENRDTWRVSPGPWMKRRPWPFPCIAATKTRHAPGNRFVYSMVLTRQVTDRFRWVFQNDLGSESLAEIDRGDKPDSAKWYSVVNYLYYDITPHVVGGIRAEWFRDQDNARVLAIPSETLVSGGNYVGLTGGLNVKMGRRWLLRPELRWDWSDVVPPGGGGMFNDFTEDGQITGSFDLIFQL